VSAAGSGVAASLTGAGTFQVRLALAGGPLIADEPVAAGGLGSGPSPYELVSAGLAACTAMTMNLYAARKGWDLSDLTVEVAHARIEGADRFTRQIGFGPGLDEAQRTRLVEIAGRCPVHRTLEGGAEIVTLLADAIDESLGAEPEVQHAQDMREACEQQEG
jgi:putative redox protein